MKKLYLLLLFPLSLFAQQWAPAGATWYYGVSVWTTAGYYKIEYVGDTTISSIQCKELKKTFYVQNLAFLTSDTAPIGTEYTYADSNKVYIFKRNQFYTLYDFSAKVGETWTVPEIKHYNSCDTVGVVRVDSIGSMNINNQNLRYICISLADTSQKWGWNAKIVERIGPINSYLFPVKFDYCGMQLDEIAEGGNFRCYSDNTPFAYSSNIVPICDFITAVKSIDKNSNQINIYPNPASNKFTIEMDNLKEPYTLEILNTMGQVVLNKQITNKIEQIDLSGQAAGVYFVKVQTGNNTVVKKIIKE